MRKVFVLFFTLISTLVLGQDFGAADFSLSVSDKETTVGETVVLTFSTAIPEGLHIYANAGDCEIGPKKPWFEENLKLTDCQFVGAIYDGIEPHKYKDDLFNCNVSDFAIRLFSNRNLKLPERTQP